MGLEFDRLLHGGDYNPEQWMDAPEILSEDLKLMKKAHVNCVTLGVFSWSVLEPEEGVFCFEWLEEIIDKLYENDIRTILATPTGALPHWLTAKYPETMQVGENGVRNLPGRRHNFCYTSRKMREKAAIIDGKLGELSTRHPGIIMWHISNEMGGNFSDSACHCEQCQQAFREWLRERYGTLLKLNEAWWTTFWSHTYTDFEQIHSPSPNGEPLLHGLNLDWRRFVTHQMTDFLQWEISSVRKYSSLPATTNFMHFFKPLNYYEMAKAVDVVSWDSYPFWHKRKDEVPAAVKAAAYHSMMRSLKKRPFMLMESTPSCVNWRTYNPVKRPGMHMLSSLQAIAHGSNTVQYFQWRKGRGSFEKFHGAVLDHQNGENTRTFKDVTSVGCRLEHLGNKEAWGETLSGSCNKPKAAMIFDWENWWAVEDAAGPRLDIDYKKIFLSHYRAFWEAGIDVDIINMDCEINEMNSYKMIIAPFNYLYKNEYADKAGHYVENGGVYITTCYSGVVNESDLCFTAGHPLQKVLGIRPEEIDAPGEEFRNSICYGGEAYKAGSICEIAYSEGAETIASFEKEFYQGSPAVTVNKYGKGKAYYLASNFEQAFLNRFYADCAAETGIQNPLGTKLPYGVTVSVRENNGKFIFVQNFNDKKTEVECLLSYMDADSGRVVKGIVELQPFECKILYDRKP